MPPQPTENHYITDFIARRSLKRSPLPDGSGDGWTWKFDPKVFKYHYQAALRELIARKLKSKGRKIEVEDEKPRKETSNVIDLMAALKKSLGDEKKGKAEAKPKKSAKKASAKKEQAKAHARKRA